MSSLCKKDGRYMEVIKDSYVVKNAVILLGGQKKKEGEGEKDVKEGEEATEEEMGRREEEKGRVEMVECIEMRVREKISLLELLSELVKGGVEMEDEEELKEVGMMLEEEGNNHVEEEIEGGEGRKGEEVEENEKEKDEEEKREWEELSEKAHQLVWVMEKMKNRREGKRSDTMRMVKRMKEKDGKVEDDKERMEEEKQRAIEEKRKMEEELKAKKEEDEGWQNLGTRIGLSRSLEEVGVEFGDGSVMRTENNSIIHNNEPRWVPGFVGGKLDNSVHRMFE